MILAADSELMITQVEASTEEEAEFIDAYLPGDVSSDFTVVDSGRILLPESGVEHFLAAAREHGLCEIEKVDLVIRRASS